MEQPRRLDLRSLLTRAEAAAPVGVVDAMADALREMLGARDVQLLDRRLQRPVADPARSHDRGPRRPADRAARRPPDRIDARAARLTASALAAQRSVVLAGGRGHARARSGDQPWRGGRGARARSAVRAGAGHARGSRARRAPAGVHGHRQPALHRSVRVGPAHGPALAGGRDPAAAAAGVVHVRGGPVHAGGLAGAGRSGRRGHVRLLSGPGHAARVDDRRDGALGRVRAAGHARGGRLAQHPQARRRPGRAGPARQSGVARARVTRRVRDRAVAPGRSHRPERARGQCRAPPPVSAAGRPGGGDRADRAIRRSARSPTPLGPSRDCRSSPAIACSSSPTGCSSATPGLDVPDCWWPARTCIRARRSSI